MDLERIRPMVEADWPAVRAIYQAGIATGDATFETSAPESWAAFEAIRLPAHRFVAVTDPVPTRPAGRGRPHAAGDRPATAAVTQSGAVLGWVAASPVSRRPAYAGVVEHSVYVAPAAAGRGVGRALLTALIESTEAAGIWTIQSAIFPENTASLALHERAGFRVVGRRERIARRHGHWRDVLLLERRSPLIG